MQAIPDNGLCYLNGVFGALADARISVLDRGFLFGDGVYEEVPVYGRRMFRFDKHMARLGRSLQKVRIGNPLDAGQWLSHCRQVIAAQASDDQLLYIQVTRGVAPRDPAMPLDIPPTVFIMSRAWKTPDAELRHQGVACITARDFRWERGDIRSISLQGSVLARQLSADHGAVETILFRDGYLTEASASNVWVVHEGALLGPPPGEHRLEGVRYELLRDLCEEEGIAFNLRPLPEVEVLAADELMLSSAGHELLPVTRLDGEPVGHGALRGKPGPVFAKLHEAYQRAKATQSF